ncbi:MAG TPA: glycoside hydrolase family 38 C-terminal domain-containing protein [Gemmatimonadaceae bacterium]|nr:glycoside hydrolase family 38 C-terminal domain-containing protein [Gemmatimonadaceae bacterium]
MALDAHIVSHTHWDREWYHTAERFRQRLVALIDELLDDPPGPGESFLLDGQAIVIDDYLDVRPDRAGEIGRLLGDGRLEAGPWYVLADELIPSGEALVRNLLAGRRALRRFEAIAPPVLYCPDSFGHPAMLPAIAAGFGLPMIILWRGYGGTRWPAGDSVRWAAPSGDEALVFHLPRDGYEFGSHLPVDPEGAGVRWQRMRDELAPRSTTGVMLIPHGADHHARQTDHGEAIAALEHAGASDSVHRSSLRQFAEHFLERSATQRLPLVRGELRDSYGYTWTLQGTFASRAHEKRLNARAERIMLREAEPWSALAARKGPSRRALVDAAWRTVLTAHPHDTICGCSIDDVAAAMEGRLHSSINQAAGIRDDAIADLIEYDAAAARVARDRWSPTVIVRNAAPRIRSGVALIDIEEFIADVPVGPGSAPAEANAAGIVSASDEVPTPQVPALGALQVVAQRIEYSRTESPHHYPDNDLVGVTRVAAWIEEAPAYGVATYAIGVGDAPRRRARRTVVAKSSALQNEHLHVTVSDAGIVSLVHAASGREVSTLFEFLDDADVGDLYTPAPRRRPFEVRFQGKRRTHRGPLRGAIALRYRILDAGDGARGGIADVVVNLTLDADATFVRVGIHGVNLAEDHRLRIAFHTDVVKATVWPDAAFGAIRRERLVIDDAEAAVEQSPPTAPLHRYVSLFGEHAGVTIFSDGLAEYEARDDGSVAITLVRAVGELSKNNLPERPGHAGWPAPTPAAQCLGPFEAEFAVMPHGARLALTIDAIEQTADDVLLPLCGVTLRSAIGTPASSEGVALTGPGLAFSAIKESEDGEWLVLRCVNLRDDEVAGQWRLPFDVATAKLARLDETAISDIATTGDVIDFRAPGRGIVTVLVR